MLCQNWGRTMRTFLYDEREGLIQGLSLEELVERSINTNCAFWIDCLTPDPKEIHRLGEVLGLHPLAIEDLINSQHRPKIDVYENGLLIVVRDADVDRIEKGARALELDLFLGRNFLITVHTERMESIEMALNRLEGAASRTLGRGPDYLMHWIIDMLVDDNLQLLNWLDEEISDLEEDLFTAPTQDVLMRTARLRKNVIYLQRIMAPELELIKRLAWDDLPFIKKSLRVYFRDVYDNLARINDLVYAYREIVSSDMATHQTLISNRLNEVMKTLTIIATIMLPLTLITGLFGMNVDFPGHSSKFAFWAIIAGMSAMSIGMLFYFKRRGWFG
jgi:magnesium transporter